MQELQDILNYNVFNVLDFDLPR